ncbi:MAG: hypothetical protein NVSMB31_10280 [Vulcanimicrobiaceae bacterium]
MHATLTGGVHSVARRAELESAVGGPLQTWSGQFMYPSLYLMAAALLRSLAQNQPFTDGNKRIAWTAAVVFLDINGVSVTATTGGVVDMMKKLAEKELEVPEIAEFLEKHSTTVASLDTGTVCGLCGKSDAVMRSDCCGNLICDDQQNYVLFSYARNSCDRNHSSFTLCGFHHNEGHVGDWKTCAACRHSFETEIYVWYGTNEYNFERLSNPPKFKAKRCASCKSKISLSEDGYTIKPSGEYLCEACFPGAHL